MISTAIWISSDEAKIFQFKAEGVDTHHMRAHGIRHHKETLGKNHSQENSDAEKFFHEVATYLCHTNSQRWLILGPGPAKTHFQHHIERHHANFKKAIFAVEPMDKGSDGEIKNFAHDYFKKKGVFEST